MSGIYTHIDPAGAQRPLLAGVAVFNTLARTEMVKLEKAGRIVQVGDSTPIFAQGDASDAVYAIIGGEGRVRIGSMDRHSKALMVETLLPGDTFGEVGVIDNQPRTASAVSQGPVRLFRIPATVFRAALAENAALGAALCGVLARRLRRTFALFQDASFENLEVRLARQVLYLAERGGRPVRDGVRLSGRIRQGDLADLLGTTTRSIITILNAWRAAGLVGYDANRALLTLTNVSAITELMHQEQP